MLCPDCRLRATGTLPSLQARATQATIGLYAVGGSGLAVTIFNLVLGSNPNSENPLLVVFALVTFAYLSAFLGSIVLFSRWFHLAVRHALGRGIALGVTPAAAVVGWFIPIVNLVRPFRLAREMLRGSRGDESVIGVWQTTWLLGNVLSNASVRFHSDAIDAVAGLLMLGAAWCAARVVAVLTASLTSPAESGG